MGFQTGQPNLVLFFILQFSIDFSTILSDWLGRMCLKWSIIILSALNFRVKGKKLYFGFVDLEKAFDRVPREVISWALRKLGVEEWLVSAVMSMYIGAKTVVRTVYGNSKGFEVKVGMHQGSGLSPLLFVIVMEAISREFRVALP